MSTSLRKDAALAAVLACVPLALLWSVPLWKDPSIYHYMAWGLGHGMVPYRDTIDPNWPGVLPLHQLGQALSGKAPWGMRLVDAVLLFALLATSAYGLERFRVPFSVRATASLTWVALYVSDPANPFGMMVQRDPLQLPFVAPFWVACMRHGRERAAGAVLVAVGLAAGFAVWMKPTIALFLVAGYVVAALRDRRGLVRLVSWTALGGAFATAAMLAFLFVWCDPAGFWEWGVRYTFGPYSAVRQPLGLAVRYVFHQLLFAGSPLPFAMLALGYVGLRVRVVALARERWSDLFASLVWVLATIAAFLSQGKCFPYQALPMHWTLTMAGALWFGTAVASRPWRIPERVALAVSVAMALLAFRFRAHPLDDEALAAMLPPQHGEIVVVGCLPGLLFDLQARTPLPEVCSNLVYYFGSEETHAIVGRHLDAALRDPDVRVVVVEAHHAVFGRTSLDMLERWAPPLETLGYARAPELEPSDAIQVHLRR